MHNAKHNPLGFEGHAMLLSLPPVLLIWAIVAFSAAIIAYALQNVSSLDATQIASAWVVVVSFVVILVFVSMGLYTFSIIWKWQSPTSNILRSFRWKRRRDTEKSIVVGPRV